MTDSESGAKPGADARSRRGGKRERLVEAAVQVFHEQGVEKTTLADIARAGDVPLGNVYYYFKTKDHLVEAAVDAHCDRLTTLTARLDTLPDPADRLKTLIAGWVEQRETAARFGCPFGTLATELDKRDDGLDLAAAKVMRALLDWVERQFTELGRPDARALAVELVAAYQGMSVLTNTLRDPGLMADQGSRLQSWIDGLARP
ncbi:AcrR family transcriptional regulator [Streptomyces griseochromogenes]|uniref:AcrR family transcriptional regulator n=1 Tax=Streptomyces griseochromogenes TaxID=68214 RepID=A0A1B1B172_9ACTN|nr:TetR/AcrR family transcriptional regulator [Streptomyces griseochromogenes]ANP52578.1 TetR family transcriptional regulator [Streptomyces griseochromogenes]MBP2047150.1 AcrR family transcriptional regulator [Streptomyces griseochromogenes]